MSKFQFLGQTFPLDRMQLSNSVPRCCPRYLHGLGDDWALVLGEGRWDEV